MVFVTTGLIAGTLDLIAALLLFTFKTKQHPAVLLRYIASAAFGTRAINGGNGMAFAGLCFHYLIAMFWTALYFFIFPKIFPCSGSVVANAVIYGMFVWIIMNLVILPLSKAEPRPFSPQMALINVIILILAIGLPCAYALMIYPAGI